MYCLINHIRDILSGASDEQSINKVCNLILKDANEIERILNIWKVAASKFQECTALIKVMININTVGFFNYEIFSLVLLLKVFLTFYH